VARKRISQSPRLIVVPFIDRLTMRIKPQGDCWIWQGMKNPGGYGMARTEKDGPHQGKMRLVHRLLWEMQNGPIPSELELDHRCRRRDCVNPAHLELVTGRENVRRGAAPAAFNARKTHCIRGHPLKGENVYHEPSRPHVRKCRACRVLAYTSPEYRRAHAARERARRKAVRDGA
jgi:hypothetical protein